MGCKKRKRSRKAAYGLDTMALPQYQKNRIIPNYDAAIDANTLDVVKQQANMERGKYSNDLANFGMMIGSKMLNSGIGMLGSAVGGLANQTIGGVAGNIADNLITSGSQFGANLLTTPMMFGFGGDVSAMPVEIEGDETVEYPNGQVVQYEGPSHESGGIDMNLPEGTEVYSKRIKKYNKTLADRKAERTKQLDKIQKRADKNQYDVLLQGTVGRVSANNKLLDEQDKTIQGMVRDTVTINSLNQKYKAAYGIPPWLQYQNMARNGGQIRLYGENGLFQKSNGAYDLGDLNGTVVTANAPAAQQPLARGLNIAIGTPTMLAHAQRTIPLMDNSNALRMSPNAVGSPTMLNRAKVPLMNNSNALGIAPNVNIGRPDEYNIPLNIASKNKLGKTKSSNINWSGIGKTLGNAVNDVLGQMPSVTDMFGMYAQYRGAKDLMNNTIENLNATQPNINPYEHYGEQGLNTLDTMAKYFTSQRDNQYQDLERQRNQIAERNRNSARGINTLRALDLISDAQLQKGKQSIDNAYNQQMANLNYNKANKQDMRDRMFMSGEQQRDLANRQDIDNYYTNRAQDLSTKYQMYQQLAREMNNIRNQRESRHMIEAMSPYGSRWDSVQRKWVPMGANTAESTTATDTTEEAPIGLTSPFLATPPIIPETPASVPVLPTNSYTAGSLPKKSIPSSNPMIEMFNQTIAPQWALNQQVRDLLNKYNHTFK